jgi:hypothetical protein
MKNYIQQNEDILNPLELDQTYTNYNNYYNYVIESKSTNFSLYNTLLKYELFYELFTIIYKETFISVIKYLRNDNIQKIEENEIYNMLNQQDKNIEDICNIISPYLIDYLKHKDKLNAESKNFEYQIVKSFVNGFNMNALLYRFNEPIDSIYRYNTKWYQSLSSKLKDTLSKS